ncbi:hypothetical protein [Streptomyces bobili]
MRGVVAGARTQEGGQCLAGLLERGAVVGVDLDRDAGMSLMYSATGRADGIGVVVASAPRPASRICAASDDKVWRLVTGFNRDVRPCESSPGWGSNPED